MALTLDAVQTAARDRNAAFFYTNVTNAVVARFLSDYQNELIAKAAIRDRQFLAQTAVISIAMASGAVGAGTGNGAPGITDGDTFATTTATTGSLIEAGVTSADGAAVLIGETVVTSATATTLTRTGAARTTNGDVGKVLVITQGTGTGQRREVLSNTAEQWAISTGTDGEQWEVTPDGTSMFTLVQPALLSDDTAGVVTALPSMTSNQGYLVKLNAAGVPFIDYASPITATVEQGVPLPAMHALLPTLCQCWPIDRQAPEALTVTTAQRRFHPDGFPAVYVIGQTLYLCGCSSDWADIASLELRYVPIAPVFTALTDYFLLPDMARPALVAKAAEFMALRVAGRPGVALDPAPFAAAANAAERDFLRAVTLGARGRGSRIREVW